MGRLLQVITILAILSVMAGCSPSTGERRAEKLPTHIMLNMTAEPSGSMAVTWRMPARAGKPMAQIAPAAAFVPDSSEIRNVEGIVTGKGKWIGRYKSNRVVMDGLRPLTRYVYRVGDGRRWSEWFQFTTADDSASPFSFLYFGDLQNQISQSCSRVIRQACLHFPDSRFMLFTGDLVDFPVDRQWGEFFSTGSWLFATVPVVATPGNHEFADIGVAKVFSKHWDEIFHHPRNGIDGLMNRMYYFDYQNVRFISFDAFAFVTNQGLNHRQTEWLAEILETNPCKWTVIFMHYPVYSCLEDRDKLVLREKLKPLFEEFGVDLVLQGHDHIYCRGQFPDSTNQFSHQPVYVISVTGAKANTLNPLQRSERAGQMVQLYQHIGFSGDTLSFTAWTVNGKLFDSFLIVKQADMISQLIENRSTGFLSP